MATSGEPGLILRTNSRPARSGTPSARNSPGLTICSAVHACASNVLAGHRTVVHSYASADSGANGALVIEPTARIDGSVSAT